MSGAAPLATASRRMGGAGADLVGQVAQRPAPGPLLRLLFDDPVDDGQDRLDGEQRAQEGAGTADAPPLLEVLEGVDHAVDDHVRDERLDPVGHLVETGPLGGQIGGLDDEQPEPDGERAGVDDADGDAAADGVGRRPGRLERGRHPGGEGDAQHAVVAVVGGRLEGLLEGAGRRCGCLGQDRALGAAGPELRRRERDAVDELLARRSGW